MRSSVGDANAGFVSWLVTGAVGPALVALPVNLVADKLAGAAVRWFKRCRQTDDLSSLVKAAAGASAQLSRDEIKGLRNLLENEGTWRLLAGGKLHEKLQELTGKITKRLSARDGRTADAIARGLLEFAVFDLQPDVFQKVVLARLQQVTDQASALDAALFRMHKDLYHLVDEAKDLFRQAMDRLPPGSADLGEIRIYLETLIDWLNTDSWPGEQRLGGPVLTPATIERQLRVSPTSPAHPQDIDADELARQCSRLVILGGPGSGKTWLTMRTARICAEQALVALEAGMALNDVELPLYTTCARLIRASGGIREAAASSAIERIGDLGGSRIIQALRLFFTERDTRTLLVIDSLDEARDAAEARIRLREADWLRPPWRVILTSRPSSWDNQLKIEKTNQTHRVGELRPLRYPSDVEAVIQQWFADRPERGQALAAQIGGRPSLQQAATVPLILAFYCILGGHQPLPEFRYKLYKQVINRMLHGLWRSGIGPPPDLDDCRAALRAWAWPGVKENHPISGIGQWEDDVPTQQALLSPVGQVAVDHIATPLGGPDFDTDQTLRRFVHRSIREHLVAEYVAGLSVEFTAEALLPHLWYDPDWEYAAPAAIAMHKHPDQLLQGLFRRITLSDRIPDDVAALDAGWEVRKLLARVAAESREDDWSPAIAAAIAQARMQLARSGRTDDLAGVWESSNRQVREVLLTQLADQTSAQGDGETASRLAGAIARLNPTGEDRDSARETLLKLLSSTTHEKLAERLTRGMVQLATTARDRLQTRDALLSILASERCQYPATVISGTVQLASTAHDKRQVRHALLGLLVHQDDGRAATQLADGVVQLAPTARDNRQTRDALLGLLAHQNDGQVAVVLAESLARTTPTTEDMHQARGALLGLLSGQTDYKVAADLTCGVAQLAPTARDKRQTREALLELLAGQTDFRVGAELVYGVMQLAPQLHDKHQSDGRGAAEEVGGVVHSGSGTRDEQRRRRARETLFTLLAGQTSAGSSFDPRADKLVDGVVHLAATMHEKRQACQRLLGLLAGLSDPFGDMMAAKRIDAVVHLTATRDDRRKARQALLGLLADQHSDGVADKLMNGLARLALTARDKRETREALLELLPGHPSVVVARRMVYGLSKFAATAQDQRRAREALIALLPRSTDSFVFSQMVDQVVHSAPTAQGQRQARAALLDLLTRQTDSNYRCSHAQQLVGGLARLNPTASERRRARETLLGLLAEQTDSSDAAFLACGLAQLAVTPQQRRQASGILVRLLVGETYSWIAKDLASSLVQIEPETRDRYEALDALAGLLADQSGFSFDGHPANGFVQLAVTADDKRHMREVLVGLLASDDNVWAALRLAEGLTRLAPTTRDRRLAREALLKLLRHHPHSNAGTGLIELVVQLAPTAPDRRQIRKALLGLLADQASDWYPGDWRARNLVDAVIQLATSREDMLETRQALVGLLTSETEGVAHEVVSGVVQLAPTPQGKRQAREALLRRLNDLLDDGGSYAVEEELLGGIAQLSPTADDLIALTGWWVQPSAELIAAARPNSLLSNWLMAIRVDGNHTHLASEH